MSRKNPTAVFAGLLAAALAWAYLPQLMEFAANTWEYRPHYQHFPFVLAASLLLFLQRLAYPSTGGTPRRRWVVVGIVAAWLLLAAGHLLISPVLTAASAILIAGATGVLLARRLGVPFPIGPWALLWLTLPPPIGFDQRLIEAMQRQSSQLASLTLDVLRVNHLMDGNALVLPGKSLFVDEACSGIVSAVSIVTCAAIYGVWRRRGLARTLALMALSAGWAVLMNVLRITAIALAESLAGWNWADGIAHTLVGLGGFAFALVTIFLTDWLVNALLTPVGERWAMHTGEPIQFGGGLVDAWDWMVGEVDAATPGLEPEAIRVSAPPRRWEWRQLATGSLSISAVLSTSLAFGSLGVIDVVFPAEQEKAAVIFPHADAFASALQAPGTLPEEIGELRLESVEHVQRETDSLFANHSVTYTYMNDVGESYLVSCDFPYAGGWHELSVCYRGIGWRLDGREVKQLSGEEEALYDAAFLDLTRPEGTASVVAFCGRYADGEPVPAPAMTLQETVWNALSRRGSVERRNSYQVQVLTQGADAISDRRREECQILLEKAQAAFAQAAERALQD